MVLFWNLDVLWKAFPFLYLLALPPILSCSFSVSLSLFLFLSSIKDLPPISQALFIIFTVLLKGERRILEDWQQAVDLFSLYQDYESERTIGVSHFHLMTVYSFMWNGFLGLFFGSYGKMCFIVSTADTKSYCYWESRLRGVKLSEHLDLHMAPPYPRSFPLPLLVLWRQRSFGGFGLDLGFFEDYIYSEPESRKNLPASDSLILQIALSIEMSAAMPSSSNVLFLGDVCAPKLRSRDGGGRQSGNVAIQLLHKDLITAPALTRFCIAKSHH